MLDRAERDYVVDNLSTNCPPIKSEKGGTEYPNRLLPFESQRVAPDNRFQMSVFYEQLGRAFVIRFMRPELRNPLSSQVIDQLYARIDALKLGHDYDRLVLTGAGDIFASGADLREIAQLTSATASEFAIRGQALMRSIGELPIPAIAAINGYCLGGGLDLALACKQRIASPNAVFSHPGVGLGIITGWGGTQRLPRLVGQTHALEMLLTANRINADHALRIGLIDAITDDPLAAALETSAQKL